MSYQPYDNPFLLRNYTGSEALLASLYMGPLAMGYTSFR
jgi:hypothetical protein